ncbi:MAG: ATP-binding cassette domain-containing protein [Muribaculaceae bacterium]|nr:ATP-binding cassette domain-containing protein [Muribaculaceae bacterium]
MLTFDKLSYSYYSKGVDALSDVTASVGQGICLVLGENGAGKSTLLGLAAGNLTAKAGAVVFDGVDTGLRLPSAMSRIFFLPDDYRSPFRTVRDMVRFHAPFYPQFDPDMLDANLAAFGLSGSEHLKHLSLGMAHKSYIAFALALRAPLLLLDEPANGLDIDSRKELRRMLSRCVDETQTVLISTHTVADMEVLYDSVLVLRRSHLALCASAADIQASLSFVSSPVPPADALYFEPDGAAFRAIVAASTPYETSVDYALLYSAMMSDAAGAVVEHLNKRNDER